MHQRLEPVADDVFRLAVLLTGSPAAATALVRRADIQHPEAILEALLAALPLQRTARATWASVPAARTLAALTVPQRAALGGAALFAMPAEVLAASVGPAAYAEAVLACAPAELQGMFAEGAVPAACAPWRAALQRSSFETTTTPELRGHLALCAECRAAAQAWRTASATAETQVRELLRPFTAPAPEPAAVARPRAPRRAILLILLVVLLITGVLVWPRQSATVATSPQAAATGPAQLLQRASETLYQPLPAGDVSHLTYAIHWSFDDGSYAILQAHQWDDPLNLRTRLELKHEQGGGAYELYITHGQKMWYRAAQLYSRTMMPYAQSTVGEQMIGLQNVDPAAMRAARLASGPWAVAWAYLRAASGAAVQSLGTQQSPDGRTLHLLRFDAPSPVYSNTAEPAPVPIVLLIDTASGRLIEIRELTGPAGGEQRVFVPWRLVQQETLPTDTPELAEPPRADQLLSSPIDPSVPLRSGMFSTPTDFYEMPLLAVVPDGINRASRIAGTYAPTRYSGDVGWIEVMMYPERPRIRVNPPETSARVPFETAALTGTLTLQMHQRIDGLIEAKGSTPLFFRITAQGFSQQELLPVLDGLRTLTPSLLVAQGNLFIWPQKVSPESAAYIYRAIEGLAADSDQPTRTTIDSYQRARPDRRYSDPLSLLNEKRSPEQSRTVSTIVPGEFRRSETFGEHGVLIQEYLESADAHWFHSPVLSSTTLYVPRQVSELPPPSDRETVFFMGEREGISDATLPLWEGREALVSMLQCGSVGNEAQADGTIVLLVRDRLWRQGSCLLGARSRFAFAEDARPYLADLREQRGAFVQRARLSPTGELLSVERVLENDRGDTLLWRWEIVERQAIPASTVPAAQPPPAAFERTWAFVRENGQLTLQQFGTQHEDAPTPPVWGLRPDIPGLTNVAYFSPTDAADWPLNMLLVDNRISRSTFQIYNNQPRVIYQGPRATMLAALQETMSPSRTSTFALSVRLGEERVRAWEYTTVSDDVITLIDAGDTMLMIPEPLAQARGIAGLLAQTVTP